MDIILHKDQPPKRVHRKKELYKLLIARSDIGAAINAVKLMLETVSGMGDDLYYPLFASVVICYARPFTNNDPYGALPKRYQRFKNENYRDTHKKLISARHELIAHSDMTVRKAMIVPAGVVIGKHLGNEWKSSRIETQTSFYLFPMSFFKLVHDTSLDLNARLDADIETLVEELYGGLELPAKAFKIRIDNGM